MADIPMKEEFMTPIIGNNISSGELCFKPAEIHTPEYEHIDYIL